MRKTLVLLIIVGLFYSSGCYNIRRKFIRTKKISEDITVYVDFKDYPSKPAREAYIDYYLFVRGWLDELNGALRKGISHKRQKRAINEAVLNLEQIISFYTPEGKEQIYPLYKTLLNIRDKLSRFPNLSSMQRNALISKIEKFKRKFEREFNYTDAEKWMI